MGQTIHPANSLAEAHFYLMLQRCSACGQGPLRAASSEYGTLDDQPVCSVRAFCRSCGEGSDFHFDAKSWTDAQLRLSGDPDDLPIVNPTVGPSGLIDLAQCGSHMR